MVVETRAHKRKVKDGLDDNVAKQKNDGVQMKKKRKAAPKPASKPIKATSKPVDKKEQIKNNSREMKITQGVNFQPICREWQAEMCRIFGLQVEQPCEVEHGQLPTLIPDDTYICTHKMGGGGACLFCTWSFVITGVQKHSSRIRSAVLQFMRDNSDLMASTRRENESPDDYIRRKKMDKVTTFATDAEVRTLATMTRTRIWVYAPLDRAETKFVWLPIHPFVFDDDGSVREADPEGTHAHESVFIVLKSQHFEPLASLAPAS